MGCIDKVNDEVLLRGRELRWIFGLELPRRKRIVLQSRCAGVLAFHRYMHRLWFPLAGTPLSVSQAMLGGRFIRQVHRRAWFFAVRVLEVLCGLRLIPQVRMPSKSPRLKHASGPECGPRETCHRDRRFRKWCLASAMLRAGWTKACTALHKSS